MRVIKGKVNRNIALDALASGAVFKPLKSDYNGRLYMKIQTPVDGAYCFNAVRMDNDIHTLDW